MKPSVLRAFFLLVLAGPVSAGQIDVPVSGELKPGSGSGVGAAYNAPVPLQLSVPTLTGAQLTPSALALTPAPAIQPAMLAAQQPALLMKAEAITPVFSAASVPSAPGTNVKRAVTPVSRSEAAQDGYGDGRVRFDQAKALSGGVSAPSAGDGVARERSFLPRGEQVKAAASRGVPEAERGVKIRWWEAADMGALALGLQLLSGIVFLIAGAHASYPALAGALWALGGAGLIKHLASLRSVVVGGWQASHDQKMRVDYATGKLKDIRGHKYGQDRLDIMAPGRVTSDERFVVDAAAVALGLPWVFGGGPAAVGLYLLSAASMLYLRRSWRRRFPQPEGATAQDAVFERDR